MSIKYCSSVNNFGILFVEGLDNGFVSDKSNQYLLYLRINDLEGLVESRTNSKNYFADSKALPDLAFSEITKSFESKHQWLFYEKYWLLINRSVKQSSLSVHLVKPKFAYDFQLKR